jgi:amidohydrolase
MSAPDLVAIRRHLHAHPELGWSEYRTTTFVVAQLEAMGLAPTVLPSGTGLLCDLPAGPDRGRSVLLRADLDALPLDDIKHVPYASTVPGVCHACGHDVHTAMLLGAAASLAAEPPPGRVRLLFQPAEERLPGGALAAIEVGALDGMDIALALHCDPALDVGQVGLRTGPITAACDHVEIVLRGPGGHTSRPQNTVDLVYALGAVITELPAALSRRVDPRAALSLVWGAVHAGDAANAIPGRGSVSGTVRVLDRTAWERAPELLTATAQSIAATYGAEIEVDYVRGVPPVVNDVDANGVLAAGVLAALGPDAAVPTAQSLGGEDFGWFGDKLPSAMARLGVRTPGGRTYDLHQPAFDVDERCLDIGAAVLAASARSYLAAAQTC